MIVNIILCSIIIVLGILLFRKSKIHFNELFDYQKKLMNIKNDVTLAEAKYQQTITKTQQAEQKYASVIQQYDQARNQIDELILDEKREKLKELNEEFILRRKEEQEKLSLTLNIKKQQYQELQQGVTNAMQYLNEQKEKIQQDVAFEQKKFQDILAPLRQYQREQQEKLFYTIQVPEEYRDDINFLLTSVAQKVRHPDIISKLVWSEYIKPYLDDTFKRIEIKAEPGIYKLTNINTNKPYIGKSTDVKKRITDHFKGSVGIRNIADQAVHHAILQDGIWNWTIEIITYCDKDKLSELEKYYIDFFKAQEYGYNKTGGG